MLSLYNKIPDGHLDSSEFSQDLRNPLNRRTVQLSAASSMNNYIIDGGSVRIGQSKIT